MAVANHSPGNRFFCTTHWTVVLKAGRSGPDAQKALARLCEAYWHPLYFFARRKGKSPEDSEDLVQAFFAHLLEGGQFAGVDSAKGKFRSFLLASMTNFMSNDWKRGNRAKRGGGAPIISIDAQDAEGRYLVEPSDLVTPEMLFERSCLFPDHSFRNRNRK